MEVSNLDFTKKIKFNLERKIASNPQYSLRSYAKQLGVSPATLSGILNGKRKVTAEILGKIGFAMDMPADEVWNYQRQLLGHPHFETKNKFNELSQDIFTIISEWHHLTILELMKLGDFQPHFRWISKRLGININQAKMAVERLEKVGILKIEKNGQWIDLMDGFTTHYQKEKTTESRKRYQKQILEKSLQSLQQDDYSLRDHSSTTMAIDKKDILKAKDEIQKFRKKLSRLLEETNNKNEVYQLQVGFFPLTNILKE